MLKDTQLGNSLAVQSLGFCAPPAKDTGLIPAKGTKILQTSRCSQKNPKRHTVGLMYGRDRYPGLLIPSLALRYLLILLHLTCFKWLRIIFMTLSYFPFYCVCSVPQSCPTLCDPIDYSPARLLCLWNFPSKNTGVGCHFFLQGIFQTQG